MKVCIAGSRTLRASIDDIDDIVKDSGFNIDLLICGMAYGIDRSAYNWAMQNKIGIDEYYPDWDNYGKRAGYLRNQAMVKEADAVIVIWDGVSKGSKHTIDLTVKYKKTLILYKAIGLGGKFIFKRA